ncbi:MAG: four helix bundle protein [Phycisphaerales bacterium]|nr:four helix bundle protein [Phycisphaerales bacterium]
MAGPINSYQDLIAWQRAYAMGKAVYAAASAMQEPDRFGLPASLKRFAVSVASHIANGYGRQNTQDYLWFLKQARGEIYQLDTQLLFALDFTLLSKESFDGLKDMLDESERVLAGLIRSLER